MEKKETAQHIVSLVHDIKETSKRISQFGKIAIGFAVITVVSNIIYGNIYLHC
jgi:uncharacterized membrane protein